MKHNASVDSVVEFKNVEKFYGKTQVLGPISFELRRGQITVFLGANGAGKSTTFKLMLGLRQPTTGSVKLLGHSPRDPGARAKVGYTSQDLSYPSHLTAREVLHLVSSHFDRPVPLDEMRTRFGLEKIWKNQLGGISGGERRRVGLACALVGRPELLVLDEPTTGLDPDSRKLLWKEIESFRLLGGTVLLSTHDLREAGEIGDRVLLIDVGQIKIDGSIEEILKTINFKKISYELDGREIETTSMASDQDLKRLIESGVPFKGLEIRSLDLEEAIEIYRGTTR